MKEKFKNQKGITLIALIITIIVLLILAMISIKLIIDKGIISFANISKEETIIAGEKEKITLAYNEYKMSRISNSNYTMQEALDNEKAEATVEGDEILGWNITFQKTNHQYSLNPDGTIDEGIPDKWDGVTKEIPQIAEDNSWHIYNSAQMKYFADFVNENLTEDEKGNLTITEDTTVYLEANLDLGARANEKGEKQVGTEWTPVGIDSKKAFIGTFEGNNHYITGVYVNIEGNFGGVFGNSNTIQNLTIKNSYIQATNCSGGIVGALRTGTIENCHNINTIVEIEAISVGGVVGQLSLNANTKAINCTNTGNVSGTQNVGGIVGQLGRTSQLSNCTNSGKIYGILSAGGIVGYIAENSIIESCKNEGEIIAKQNSEDYIALGGIAGQITNNTIIKNCHNSGSVFAVSKNATKGQINAGGGIVGQCKGTIDNCSNSGKIISESCYKWNEAGGIIGKIATSTTTGNEIKNCENKGDIIAQGNGTYMSEVGGIVGNCVPTNYSILYCYNSGNVFGKNTNYIYIGGIIGWYETGGNFEMKNCYSKGNVADEKSLILTRKGHIGGNINENDSLNIKNSYYLNNSENTLKAINGKDFEENEVKGIDSNFNSLEEFLNWIKQ